MQVVNIDNFLSHSEVQEWLQTLYDCPPGRARHGYGLLTAYWRTYQCEHSLCARADGCICLYGDACRTVDRALQSLVDLAIVAPVGKGEPVPGHTHDAGEYEIRRIRGGETWGQRTAPAYIWGFEMGDNFFLYLQFFS
jgi:hypothetical protein